MPANPSDGDALYCTVSGASDIDGDTVTLRYRWYRNSALYSTEILETPVSTQTASSTSPGDQWFCTCQSSDTSGLVSAVSTSNAVPILSQVWSGTASAKVNVSTVSSNEFIILDKTGDASDSNADLTEVRVKFDSELVYFLFKFSNLTSANNPYIAIGIDTDSVSGSGSAAIGDDSPVTAGAELSTAAGNSSGGYQSRWERQVIFHSTASGSSSFAIEISSGGVWVVPSIAAASASVYMDADMIETLVRRSELGLAGSVTAYFTIAAILNTPGQSQSADTTAGNALDSVSIVRLSTGSGAGQYTNEPAIR